MFDSSELQIRDKIPFFSVSVTLPVKNDNFVNFFVIQMAPNDPEAGDKPETTEEEGKFFIDSGLTAGVRYPLKVLYCGGMYNIHF